MQPSICASSQCPQQPPDSSRISSASGWVTGPTPGTPDQSWAHCAPWTHLIQEVKASRPPLPPARAPQAQHTLPGLRKGELSPTMGTGSLPLVRHRPGQGHRAVGLWERGPWGPFRHGPRAHTPPASPHFLEPLILPTGRHRGCGYGLNAEGI